MEKYFSKYVQKLGISWDEFLNLGSEYPSNRSGNFSMAVLALRLASYANGVSKLHGEVSRKMWQGMWPNFPIEEIPISHVTNGIHQNSWISMDLAILLNRYLGPRWKTEPRESEIWDNIYKIPDEELWRTHERRRERLVAFSRVRLQDQLKKQGASMSDIQQAEVVLNPETLTIGFARRFATYKRADLLLRNKDRMAKILNNPAKPVQLIFSGKAHPKDDAGKKLIQSLIHVAREPEFRNKIVFLEDYEMVVSRYLVQGVDVWLNTPHRLYEASGTSGMKAAANGVINMSILDGWWDEAYRPGIGWAIGPGEEYLDIQYQYDVEANAMYDILEKELVPMFYSRGNDGLPRDWIRTMKDSMKAICPVFNTNRMVYEYSENFYIPAMKRFQRLTANNLNESKEFALWKKKLHEDWQSIRFERIERSVQDNFKVGDSFAINAEVYLNSLNPKDVSVEAYHGSVSAEGQIVKGIVSPLELQKEVRKNVYLFTGNIVCQKTGMQGYALRILPKHELLTNPFESRLICWSN